MAGLTAIPLKFRLLCGILSPAVTIIFISLALAGSPWFSWTENWLSDIGGEPGDRPIWSARGTPSILFNLGLFLGGILGLVFWTGLKERFPAPREEGELGMKLLLADMALFALVGVLPFSTGVPHMAVALVFFLLVPVFLHLLGQSLRQSEETREEGRLLRIMAWVSGISFLFLGAPRPWGGNAVVEMVPAGCLSVFSVYFALRYLGEEERTNPVKTNKTMTGARDRT